jgi:hypothetical protein
MFANGTYMYSFKITLCVTQIESPYSNDFKHILKQVKYSPIFSSYISMSFIDDLIQTVNIVNQAQENIFDNSYRSRKIRPLTLNEENAVKMPGYDL